MNRISNLLSIARNALVSFWSLLRWLSEDKTSAQLAEAFERAGKIMQRVLQFYSESSSTLQKGAKVITKAADDLSALAPEMQKVAESYISDVEALSRKGKAVKAAKAADRPKRKYTRSGKYSKKPASITVTTVTKPNRSASASSPVCTPSDCVICDKPCSNPAADCERSGIRK